MSAIWQLALQMGRKAPLLVIVSAALWLCSVAAMAWGRAVGDATMALTGWLPLLGAGWFWHIGQGQMLADLCQGETALLPHFRRRLGQYGLIDAAVWLVPPLLLIGSFNLRYALLADSGLLLLAVLGMATGTGRRAALAMWAIFILVGWKPELAAQWGRQALASPFTPLLLGAAAAMLLTFVLRPLLRVTDPETDTSPLGSIGASSNAQTLAPQRRSWVVRQVTNIFDVTSQRALDRAVIRFRRSPERINRLRLVRSLLLPHDNLTAQALRLVLVAGTAALYFVVIRYRQQFSAAAIGAYAIVLTMARFPQLGRGMQRMQPNLADLYLTLAPPTRADYQRTLSSALLILVPTSLVSALAYASLGALLVNAPEPARMLLTAAIVAGSASMVGLAIHLIGPRSGFGRSVAQMTVVLGAMLAYWGGYALLGAVGVMKGSTLLAALSGSFGLAVWQYAQREYQRRDPVFEIPLS